jgi:hypothetical protein
MTADGSANGRALPRQHSPRARALRYGSTGVANVTKLGGVAMALNESLLRHELRPIVLAVAAVMIAGIQALESLIDRILTSPGRS